MHIQESSNARNQGEKSYKTQKIKQKDRTKSFFTSNPFKCKWIKLSNQKAKVGKIG